MKRINKFLDCVADYMDRTWKNKLMALAVLALSYLVLILLDNGAGLLFGIPIATLLFFWPKNVID